jgi:hypothetical protein
MTSRDLRRGYAIMASRIATSSYNRFPNLEVKSLDSYPMARMSSCHDIARVISFLLDPIFTLVIQRRRRRPCQQVRIKYLRTFAFASDGINSIILLPFKPPG